MIVERNQQKSSPSDLAFLMNLANDFRAAKGGSHLEEIPLSIPSEPSRCIIAKAFNYDCMVFPSLDDDSGKIYFDSVEDANTFCNLINSEQKPKKILYGYKTDSEDGVSPVRVSPIYKWIVFMPPSLNHIALDFDAGFLREFRED